MLLEPVAFTDKVAISIDGPLLNELDPLGTENVSASRSEAIRVSGPSPAIECSQPTPTD